MAAIGLNRAADVDPIDPPDYLEYPLFLHGNTMFTPGLGVLVKKQLVIPNNIPERQY